MKAHDLLTTMLIILIFSGLFTNKLLADESDRLSNLSLEELLNVYVTTASKSEKALEKTPASVTVITNRDIKAYGWRSLADVLNAQTGFFVFSDRIYDFVVARGHYQSNDPNSRILLLLNGHSVIEGFGYFNGHLPSVDINHIKRIEIVRGPGSAIYGTNAMFAVINVITSDRSKTEQKEVIAEFGNHGLGKIALRGDWPVAGGKISIMASSAQGDEQALFFDEYVGSVHPAQGHTDKIANRQKTNNFLIEISLQDWQFSTYYNQRKKNVPTGLFGGSMQSPYTFFEDINYFFEIRRETSLNDKTQVSLRGFYDDYEFKGRYFYIEDLTGLNGPPYDSEFNRVTDSSFGFEVLFDSEWSTNYHTVAGLEYKAYGDVDFIYVSENDPLLLLNERFHYDPQETVASVFLSQHYDFNQQWDSTLGFHYDYYESVGDHLSLRGSLGYQLSPRSKLKLIYGEAFRAPNSWELNGGFFLIGNSQLTPETNQSMEFIFDYSINDQWYWHSSLFNYKTDNSIHQSTDGVEFINTAGVIGKGLESEIRFSMENTTGYFSYSYAQVKDRDTKKPISFSPESQFKIGLTHNFSDQLTLAIESQLIDERRLAEQSIGVDKAFSITNVTLTQSLFADKVNLTLSAHNLFDEDYENPSFISDLGSFYVNTTHPVYDIPGDGVTYQLKMQVIW